MQKGRVPGLQIALIGDGKTLWEKGFGVKNSAAREAVTAETVFEAASLTKTLFAYLAMKFVDEGALSLDTPLVRMLPRETIEAEIGHSLSLAGFRRDWLETITAPR